MIAASKEALNARVAEVRGLGFGHEELIDRQTLRELVPAISAHCTGGIYCRSDGAADPYRTIMAFRRAAERAGAAVIEGARVTSIRHGGSSWHVDTSDGTSRSPRG
jgi:sarcosine oxidase, subunit beta